MRLKIWLVLLLSLAGTMDAYYWDIQARFGGYFYTSHQARQAFKCRTPVYQLESSGHFEDPWVWIPWKFWANASLMLGHGSNERLGRTTSNLVTISLGLKHSWCLDACGGTFYLGAGLSLSWLKMKPEHILPEGFWDGHWHGHRKISKKNFGAVIKSGYEWAICPGIIANVFADYQILVFHYKDFSRRHLHGLFNNGTFRLHKHNRKDGHHRLDLGGFILGGSLGVTF